jgi:hypothetical protein
MVIRMGVVMPLPFHSINVEGKNTPKISSIHYFQPQVTFIKNCGVLLLNGMLTPVRGLGFLVYHRLEDGPISQNEQPTETLLFVAKHRVSIGFHHVMWSAVSSEKDEVITA